MARLHHKKGFSLIELIMTIVVVGIAAIPLSLLIVEHTRSVFQSEEYAMVVNLARFEMERVNNMPYGNITIGTTVFSNYQGYDYDITRTVSYAQGGAVSTESLKEIRVEVKKGGEAGVLVELITYLTKNINYGL